MTTPNAIGVRIADATPNSPTPLSPCSLTPASVASGSWLSESNPKEPSPRGTLTRGETWLLVLAGLSGNEKMGGPRKSPSTPALELVSPEMRKLQGWFEKFIREDEDGCWIWHGARFSSGYGACGFRRTTTVAHRAVWQILLGDLPRKLDLDHLCRVRPCVNPDHLEPVTRAMNLMRGAHPTQGVLGRSQ